MAVTPAPIAHIAARGISTAVAGLSRDERRIVIRNLRRAGVEVRGPLAEARAVQRVFEFYGRYWVDTLRLEHLDTRAVRDGFSIDGFEHVEAALETGVPPILALPHLGGWEWAARWLAEVKGMKVAAVVEELEPAELYEWFLDVRTKLGLHVIPLSDGASAVAAALADGEIMCLLCDRDISGSGVEVEFFGERTTLPGGPALVALRSGAPLLPAAVYFEGRKCRGVVSAPLDTERRGRLREDVTRVTQDLARALETQIRRAPHQWHLLQPNWPSDYVALGLTPPEASSDR
ncbi:MAG: phosphatidylinositol mannoside acyltransferase [Microthrixaceae bacterium]|nr:phosphatidylinositol mannoside acyltransferase [Microthrixaceae bacterium]MCB9386461.1 phosphatidylinositol mannoside acyltransferase [Microthrixaceae bacterium]MCO5320168.1 phosphatidylinositol mannoside acyltransferase [Microthrixaceae bacterium]